MHNSYNFPGNAQDRWEEEGDGMDKEEEKQKGLPEARRGEGQSNWQILCEFVDPPLSMIILLLIGRSSLFTFARSHHSRV